MNLWIKVYNQNGFGNLNIKIITTDNMYFENLLFLLVL